MGTRLETVLSLVVDQKLAKKYKRVKNDNKYSVIIFCCARIGERIKLAGALVLYFMYISCPLIFVIL
jgi:hypothetical protein